MEIFNKININYYIIYIIGVISIVCVFYLWYIQNNNDLNKQITLNKPKIDIMNEIIENDKLQKYTILDMLKHVAKTYPNKNALAFKEGKKWKFINYLTYYKNVVNFAQSLNYWLGENTNIAILGHNGPGWFYSHMGCMLNGGKPTGLYTTNSPEICKQILDNLEAEVLVVEDDIQLQKFIGLPMPTVKLIIYYCPISNEKIVDKFRMPVLSMGSFMEKKNDIKFSKINLENIATLIYTSGTTGSLKGCMITHKNIMTSLRRLSLMIKIKSSVQYISEEKLISYLPLNYNTTQIMDIYYPIISLSTIWFSDKDALKTSLETTLRQVKPSVFIGVPKVWEKIQEQIENDVDNKGIKGKLEKIFFYKKILKKVGLNECKMAISIGAPLNILTKKYFESIGLLVNDIYGLSETCGPISVSLPGLDRYGSVGSPIMSVKISEDNEILVKGDNLFLGYYKNKRETDNAFTKDKWFKTGDLGMLDKDGFLYITGQKKELIITTGGENISPIIIENKLYNYLKKYFEYVIVIGDKMKFLSVLLANPKKLPGDINQIIDNAINETNIVASSNSHAIKKHLILNDKFIVGKELTPTFKLKRAYIQKKYALKIQKLYT